MFVVDLGGRDRPADGRTFCACLDEAHVECGDLVLEFPVMVERAGEKVVHEAAFVFIDAFIDRQDARMFPCEPDEELVYGRGCHSRREDRYLYKRPPFPGDGVDYMFYKVELKDHIRVPPKYFEESVSDAVEKCVHLKYDGYVDEQVGFVVDVAHIKQVGEGVVIPGDGSAYYETVFELITFKPEMHEVVQGKIRDIADFGAFLTLGPIEGMVHISQTMDDFVSFAKEKVLTGKDSKRLLKVEDVCRARVIAVSFKDITNPKIGLTMRQPGLGKLEWIEEDANKALEVAAVPVKEKKK